MLQQQFPPASTLLLALAAASSCREADTLLRLATNSTANRGFMDFPPLRFTAETGIVAQLNALGIVLSLLALRVNALLQYRRGKGSINP